MDFKEALEFANQNQVCWLATSENNQPHVRGMMMWFADETGFYYHTGSTKSLSEQLKANPKVEIAYFNNAKTQPESRMMRLTGKAEILNNPELEKRLLQERPWLNMIKQSNPESELVIFRIVSGEIYFWNIMVNTREKNQPRIKFG